MSAATPTTTCPAWCTLPADHEVGNPEGRLHRGPSFGIVETAALDGAVLEVDLTHRPVFTKPTELLELGENLLAAAEWMVENR